MLISIFMTVGAVAATAVMAEPADLPEASGKAQVMEACTQCHGVDVMLQRRSPDQWSEVVSRMIGNGASMTDEQYNAVLAYLSTNLSEPPNASASVPR
jgi:competence protein ComEA